MGRGPPAPTMNAGPTPTTSPSSREGDLTYGEIHRRTNALPTRWRTRVKKGDRWRSVPQPRGFVDASVAVSKLGDDLVYLNTGFAGPNRRRRSREDVTP